MRASAPRLWMRRISTKKYVPFVGVREFLVFFSKFHYEVAEIELVSKELNHLAAILHVYAGGLIFMK